MRHLKITLSTLLFSFLIISCSSDDGDSSSEEKPNANSDSCGLNSIQGKVYSQIPLKSSDGVNVSEIPNTRLPILFELFEKDSTPESSEKFMSFRYIQNFSADENGFIDFNNLNEKDDYFLSNHKVSNNCKLNTGKPDGSRNIAFRIITCDGTLAFFGNQLEIIDNR